MPAALRALKHRNFQLFFGGQLISLTGTWMQTLALSWLVYRLTGSSLLLGTVGFVSQIPVFLVAPLGGTVAHRLGAPLTVAMGGVACIGGAIWFRRDLPNIRVEARQLIAVQAAATAAGG